MSGETTIENWMVMKAARTMNAPWATFRIFCTPKIRDRPTDARTKNPPCRRPATNDWTTSTAPKLILLYNPR
jgi:hypothetical protein